LRAHGPPLPGRLESAADLAALDAARDALLEAVFPADFERQLQRALDVLEATFVQVRNGQGITFAVRSSGDTEDRSGALGAGIYVSLLRIPRAGVPGAIRQVLASFLSPAVWVYGMRKRTPGPQRERGLAGAALIHPFVDGDATGTAALNPSLPPPSLTGSVLDTVRIETGTGGTPTTIARAAIESAARAAARVHGPIEIEWVAAKDTATFLQLRAYCPAPSGGSLDTSEGGSPCDDFVRAMDPMLAGGPWTWDAAHNPLPLSPAQAGLVEMVDALCRTGIQQQVICGYLFYRGQSATSHAPRDVADARAAFEELRGLVEPKLDALGPEPSFAAASELFVSACGPLLGFIGPACVAARRALADFVVSRLPERHRDLPRLLAGVGSVAQSRRAAADTIRAATRASDRQAAMDAYLSRFGDESPRWDVVEPTLRETPERLLAWTARQSDRQTPPQSRDADLDAAVADAAKLTLELRDGLPPALHTDFERLVASARAAIALGEDDDALFARLQAAIRRALLAVGRRLVIAGRLTELDDVFYLPFAVVRGVASQAPEASRALAAKDISDSAATRDLRLVAAEGRRAVEVAATAPPPVQSDRDARPAGILRGQPGAGGRVVGRAVHHPASVALGPESVLIAATLLPTELPLLSPGAIVVETGQPLGHVAAQARERGIPAVVGAGGAMDALPEGTLIFVDGDKGEVVVLNGT
jgi:phosphohistidine swiveling domain-containing protein